jgi:glycosyltransferase involved in cell wall biosynthesis
MGQGYDAVLVCNAANSLFIPILRLPGAGVAINVDGLEWKRKKWNWLAKRYYQISERMACYLADAVVSDAKVIQNYYQNHYGKETKFIPYGSPREKAATDGTLRRFGLERSKYFLYVSRLEPENNAQLVVEAFRRIDTNLKLAIVGDAPYAEQYIAKLKSLADERVIFTGYVFGDGYRELMSHAYCYIHATEVGGTHPALVEAMGMGNGLLVGDTLENREVAAEGAVYFSLSSEDLARNMSWVLANPNQLESLASAARGRARSVYSWERVVDAYEALLRILSRRKSMESDTAV